MPQEKVIVLALALPIAVRNWLLQSEKARGLAVADGVALAALGVGEVLAEVELAAALLLGVVATCGLLLVHAVAVSSTTTATVDRRLIRRGEGTSQRLPIVGCEAVTVRLDGLSVLPVASLSLSVARGTMSR